MVINPRSLIDEMDMLKKLGVEVNPDRLRISYAAHLITPTHQALDKALEMVRGKGNIGTTGRGIGPAYTDKASRRGLRVADLLAANLIDRLSALIDEANQQLNLLGAPYINPMAVIEDFQQYREVMLPYIADTSLELANAITAGQRILAEGAQGTLLDIDHGTYPFVTSSSTVAPGVFTGLGMV